MKVIIEKNLIDGKYNVVIDISEYTDDEKSKIKIHGVPLVSIRPERVYTGSRWISELPITRFQKKFTFSSETEAKDFISEMKTRIRNAANDLKSKKDDFSGKDELEF